jgi:DNA-binding transcriptional regulator YiaG
MKRGEIDDTFAREFNAVLKRRDLCEQKVAEHFRITSDTLERWKTGASAPHPSFQEFVLRDLEEL